MLLAFTMRFLVTSNVRKCFKHGETLVSALDACSWSISRNTGGCWYLLLKQHVACYSRLERWVWSMPASSTVVQLGVCVCFAICLPLGWLAHAKIWVSFCLAAVFWHTMGDSEYIRGAHALSISVCFALYVFLLFFLVCSCVLLTCQARVVRL